jgi:autotransporter-associated beta strand protein
LIINLPPPITFNTLIRDKNGSQAATAHTWQQSNSQGSLIFAGTLANSYQINPYAYDWAISVGSNAAQATTFASGGITGQAFALADANSGNHFQKLAGAGTITVSGAIGDASRLVNGTSTNGWNSAGVGHLIITNTGTTNLQGWNTYTGSTYIGDGTTTGGTVKISSPYAFGGNRQTDTTAPNWFSAVTGSGTGYTNGFTTAAGVTGLAAYRGAASGTFANGSIATGFKDATVAFGTVAIAAGFSLDLNGVTMLGSNALTINGVGSAAGQGVLKNSNATGATYIGSVTLGSDSNITAGTGNITLTGGLATSTYTASIDGAQNTIISSALTGTGSINKSGAGTLTLSGNNTYTGSLTINNGTVNLAGTGSALGTGTGALTFGATNTPTLNLGGRSITVGNISSSNTSALISNVNASAATLTSSAPGSTTFAGKITDGVGGGALSLVKAGSGTLTLIWC